MEVGEIKLNKQDKKQGNLNLVLNTLKQDENDFTLYHAIFIILDEGLSFNTQQLDKEAIDEGKATLKDKRITTRYYEGIDNTTDHLGDHEEFINIDRDGNEFIDTNTVVIGHFITEGYWKNYNGKQVLMADAVLYADKYPNEISLLKEWFDKGIKIRTSCEYLYCNFTKQDGIEHIHKPIIFTAHTILNSENRGDSEIIPGAYADSQLLSINMKQSWNQAMTVDLKQLYNKRKEVAVLKNKKTNKSANNNQNEPHINSVNNAENNTKQKGEKTIKVMNQIMNQLSHDDIRWKLYECMSEVLTAKDYWDMYISDVYDKYFVVTIWNDEDTKHSYAYDYIKDNNKDIVEIDVESKREVEYVVKTKWQEIKNQLDTNTKLSISLNQQINDITKEKKGIEKSLNTANETIEELKKIEIAYNNLKQTEQFKEDFNKQYTYWEKIFNAIDKDAITIFNSEEVQDLIKKSVNDKNVKTEIYQQVTNCLLNKQKNIIENNIKQSKNAQNSKFVNNDLVGNHIKQVNNLLDNEQDIPKTFEDKYINKD